MIIKSKFWPLFVEATFGSKPNTKYGYYIQCILAVLLMPASWLGLTVNLIFIKDWNGGFGRPISSFMFTPVLFLGAVTGLKVWSYLFGPVELDSLLEKWVFVWAISIPGLLIISLSFSIIVVIFCALIVWPIAKIYQWITSKYKESAYVKYEVDQERENFRMKFFKNE